MDLFLMHVIDINTQQAKHLSSESFFPCHPTSTSSHARRIILFGLGLHLIILDQILLLQKTIVYLKLTWNPNCKMVRPLRRKSNLYVWFQCKVSELNSTCRNFFKLDFDTTLAVCNHERRQRTEVVAFLLFILLFCRLVFGKWFHFIFKSLLSESFVYCLQFLCFSCASQF